MTPLLRRGLLAFAALGVAFAGALAVMAGYVGGWAGIALGVPLAGVLALAGDQLGPTFGPTLRTRAAELAAQTRPWMAFLALYVLLKVPVPLWPEGFSLLGLLSTGALFISALLYVQEKENAAKAVAMAALAFAVGLGVEVLGSRTGVPFGVYSYATAPAPTLLTVPLIVPLGWFAFTLAGTLLAGGRPWLAGVLLALWDVGLEPLMTAQRYWLWNDPAPVWAGAPIQNFIGWWAVGTGIAWGFTRIAPALFRRQEHKSTFGLAYPIETFFLPGGLVLVGRYLEAGVTLLAMLLGLGLARLLRQEGRQAAGGQRA
ncbi:carotenoid biosynthesis protein [Deinococcus sp. QL22]|uniref:carotenoid biosynthesis protein n=1 Tax=Deinococcus sp. QL22 TaxID=2939437 RepID=UPI002016AA1B|nr:carotenoid biosynthesis protein [Deinococcus sp. QL22]UQN07418.1 carotenoid biosynthesis protein [Deinococcus sp. QL22]